MIILICLLPKKTGAVIDGKKVTREQFFDTLSEWGKDDNKRFVVLHHSILSEGINVKGLEVCTIHEINGLYRYQMRLLVELSEKVILIRFMVLYVFQFTQMWVSQLQEKLRR